MGQKDDFNRHVLEVTRSIPEGRVTTYGAIARSVGATGAARRVGWVLNNSLQSVPQVPAHRVVNRNGMLSGRLHFPENFSMQHRLEAEGIVVKEYAVLNFERLFWDPQLEWLD